MKLTMIISPFLFSNIDYKRNTNIFINPIGEIKFEQQLNIKPILFKVHGIMLDHIIEVVS